MGSSGLGREVGTRAERARGVKRGHRGHLEIIGNHNTKLAGILPVTPRVPTSLPSPLLPASQTLYCLIQFNATSQTLYIERKQKSLCGGEWWERQTTDYPSIQAAWYPCTFHTCWKKRFIQERDI